MKRIIPFALAAIILSFYSGNPNPTAVSDLVADPNGNVYQVDTFGTQIWMVENLRTTKYNDGSDIPLLKDGDAWKGSNTAAYCWYNNDSLANSKTYGALYNGYAINTEKLCPAGWHVPDDEE